MGLLFVTSSILHVHVIWNQRERFTICCGAINSNKNGEHKEIDEHIIACRKNDLYQIFLRGNERYRHDTNNYGVLSFVEVVKGLIS